MLYLTCTIISSVDLEHYGVACAEDWVSVHCGMVRRRKKVSCKETDLHFYTKRFLAFR